MNSSTMTGIPRALNSSTFSAADFGSATMDSSSNDDGDPAFARCRAAGGKIEVEGSVWSGVVDGDSASAAELIALLSSLADAPIDQSFAITGSINQFGDIQAIGGVNEKIEGFFDICAERGLTGRQGVLIPAANIRNLALRRRVIDAVAEGRFRIITMTTLSDGIEVLTGLPAGARGADGTYPENSLNRRVEDTLTGYAEIRKSFAREARNASS